MNIGILGGGQLAQMLALAGIPLGLRFSFYDPAPDSCAQILGRHVCAAYDDETQLKAFAESVDVVTYEFENVPVEAVNLISKIRDVYPKFKALENTQDRLMEKQLFNRLEIPTAGFVDVNSEKDLLKAMAELGLPLVLKSRRGGYDGKGQIVLKSKEQVADVWSQIAGVPFIAEQWIKFNREVSLIATRDRQGRIVFFDLSENCHVNGILRTTYNRPDDSMLLEAQKYVELLMNDLDYCGTLALEFFQQGGRLIANEYAPRVHNSGHWTIEGSVTSQFENHLRAVVGLSLGDTSRIGYCAMINFIGKAPQLAELPNFPDCHYHSYGKDPKPGRKVGHYTLRSESADDLADKVDAILDFLKSWANPS